MKYINLAGEKIEKVRTAASLVSATGAVWSIDCVLIPFIQLTTKSRLMRLVAYSGTVMLSYAGGILASACAKDAVNAVAGTYNLFAEEVNTVKNEMDEEQKPSKDEENKEEETPKEDAKPFSQFLAGMNDGVIVDPAKYYYYILDTIHPFDFDFENEHDAKLKVEDLFERLAGVGFVSLFDVLRSYSVYADETGSINTLYRILPYAVLEASSTIGWKAGNLYCSLNHLPDSGYVRVYFTSPGDTAPVETVKEEDLVIEEEK